MTENELSKIIMDCCFKIHTEMGPGLYESVYEECLYYLLIKNDLVVERQKEIPVTFQEVKMELGFRVDLIIEKKVIIELKSIDAMGSVHHKQVLTYLRLTE
jgi:GxxExxY protein